MKASYSYIVQELCSERKRAFGKTVGTFQSGFVSIRPAKSGNGLPVRMSALDNAAPTPVISHPPCVLIDSRMRNEEISKVAYYELGFTFIYLRRHPQIYSDLLHHLFS